jgi:hypothetical protein
LDQNLEITWKSTWTRRKESLEMPLVMSHVKNWEGSAPVLLDTSIFKLIILESLTESIHYGVPLRDIPLLERALDGFSNGAAE